MKKILLFLPAIVGLLWACNPMEDTYNQLDSEKKPYSETNKVYTLVAADYSTASKAALVDALNKADSTSAKNIASQLSFNTRFTANDYMGPVLAKVYPALNDKSSAKVTYTTGIAQPTFMTDLKTINIVTDAEYKTAWGGNPLAYLSAFTPAKSPSSKIPAILKARFPSASTGTFKYVEYNMAQIEPTFPITDVLYLNDDFETHTCATSSPYTAISENGWQQKDTSGVSVKANYYCRLFSANKYAQISANGSNELNRVFLITKDIDLTAAVAPKFTFFVNVGYYTADCLTVWISSDYDGDVAHIKNATWVEITSNFTFPKTPASGYGTLATAGEANLTAYAGKHVRIAFKYSGDSRTATDPKITTTYQIDNVKVYESSAPVSKKEYDVYKYDGLTWIKPMTTDGVFVSLQPSDYLSMGVSYLSSADAPVYLPNYLKQKFPFALEGDIKNLVYKSSSTVTYSGASQYTFTNGAWVLNNYDKVVKTDQFVHNGEKWVFDPTVRFTPGAKDLQDLVDWVYTNKGRSFGSSYGNDEFYYGASAYQKNFDLRVSNKTLYNVPGYAELTTTEEKIAKTWSMLEEGLIQLLVIKYPAAVTEVNAMTVYYWLTFSTYENDLAKNTYVGIFKCTTPGATPIFERDKAFEDAQVAAGALTAAQVKWNRPTK